MENKIDLSRITYGFEFVVVMRVKNLRTGKIWPGHTGTFHARNSDNAMLMAKATLSKKLQLVEFVKATCTGRLSFAHWNDVANYPRCSEEERKQIPVPESWVGSDQKKDDRS